MANKSKMAFGTSEKLQDALDKKVIDSFDLLLLDGDTSPKVGWVDGKGVVRVVKNDVDLSGVEAELATKASIEDVETLEGQIASKVDAADIVELEAEIAKKADVEAVQSMINDASIGAIEVVEF